MAIESIYWKEELHRIAKGISPVARPKRWSERLVCTVERDLIIGFFILRRLIELNKVSSRISKSKVEIHGYPTRKCINKINRYDLNKNYDWNAENSSRSRFLISATSAFTLTSAWLREATTGIGKISLLSRILKRAL